MRGAHAADSNITCLRFSLSAQNLLSRSEGERRQAVREATLRQQRAAAVQGCGSAPLDAAQIQLYNTISHSGRNAGLFACTASAMLCMCGDDCVRVLLRLALLSGGICLTLPDPAG